MEFNNTKVGLLENKDFSAGDTLFTAHPVIILIYGSHCPYCKDEIPSFITLAAREQRILFAAIPTEGPFSDGVLLGRLSSIIPNLRGVPTFALFREGRYVSSARKVQDLMNQL